MRLLLISNSTMAGEPYLAYHKQHLEDFLGERPVNALFIPYAAVTFSFSDYENKVSERFNEINHTITSIHHFEDPIRAVEEAEVIVTGGGNTWQLVRTLHSLKLMDAIRTRVMRGTPYIGWSAGSNIACPTLRTTNDMPIVDPISFRTLDLVPFQINPHYLDAHPEGHAGETRRQRIEEFIELNPDTYVAGLREGCMLRLEENRLKLIGPSPVRIFKNGMAPRELTADDNLDFLMNR
ncbi:MAG: dipeptidase PepE [Mangrovibacterium sp.]